MHTTPLQKNHAIVLEIGDVITDGRCRNICESYHRWGGCVTFVGPSDVDERVVLNDIAIERVRVESGFGSKVLYAHFGLRSVWKGVDLKPTVIIAEDLFSLPAALVIKWFTRAPVLYDAKEFYFALASLRHRPVTQRFWALVERLCIRFADRVITSGQRDSDVIADRYRIDRPVAIHNYPPRRSNPGDATFLRKRYSIPDRYRIFLYQGWLLRGRGLFHLIDLAAAIGSVMLVIVGGGALRDELERYAARSGVADRVLFTGPVPYAELPDYTAGADVGCALIEDYGMSYRYARPNKLFEYIQAGIPVLVSDLPAMREVLERRPVGSIVDLSEPAALVAAGRRLIEDTEFYNECVDQCSVAASEYHWGMEETKLQRLFEQLRGDR
jgi:glycosyltransferase involved in cell wall biosynthesis